MLFASEKDARAFAAKALRGEIPVQAGGLPVGAHQVFTTADVAAVLARRDAILAGVRAARQHHKPGESVFDMHHSP